jgi:hypothetical protein
VSGRYAVDGVRSLESEIRSSADQFSKEVVPSGRAGTPPRLLSLAPTSASLQDHSRPYPNAHPDGRTSIGGNSVLTCSTATFKLQFSRRCVSTSHPSYPSPTARCAGFSPRIPRSLYIYIEPQRSVRSPAGCLAGADSRPGCSSRDWCGSIIVHLAHNPTAHPRIVSFLSGAHIQATTSASQSVVAFAEPVGHRPQLSFDQSSHDLVIRAGHRPQLSFDQSSHDLVILARQL